MKEDDKCNPSGTVLKFLLAAWPFILSVIVLISVVLAGEYPWIVEKYYYGRVYRVVSEFLSSVSHLVPFSVWDVFWIIFILSILAGIVLLVMRKIKFRWYILRLCQSLALIYSFFYLLWGYNYFRPSLATRLNWKGGVADTTAFRSVLDTLISQSNKNHIDFQEVEFANYDYLVEKSYSANSERLKIPYPNGTRRPKKMILSSLFVKSGVSGYFGPFFNEIHLNSYLLPMDYPFVLAHEKAHQFGITNEAEANMVAFIVCIKSDDQRIRYSGYQSLLLYFLKDAHNLKDYHNYLNKINSAVIEDLKKRQNYYLSMRNESLSDMQSAANDAYLKVNRINKGIKNYNQVVSLAVSWYYNNY